MKVRDVTEVLEQFAPLRIQEDWDNSGLCIGSFENEVKGILLGFDCTPELIDEAIEKGANMVITHHPLIFRGLKKIYPEDPVGLAVMKAIKANISIYAAHTTADKVIEGVSGAMARRLGLNNIEVLDKEPDGNGLGAVGYLPEAMDSVEAINYVKKAFNLKVARVSKPISGKISRIAMCGGAGADMIKDAMAAGAQLYISGDISYHNFFTREGFMVMDIGHFESEVEIVGILMSLLRKNFTNFAIHISENLNNSNPVYYF